MDIVHSWYIHERSLMDVSLYIHSAAAACMMMKVLSGFFGSLGASGLGSSAGLRSVWDEEGDVRHFDWLIEELFPPDFVPFALR